MPKILIKSKVREMFKEHQMSEEAVELLDEFLYRRLLDIKESKAYLIDGRITTDVMILLLKDL